MVYLSTGLFIHNDDFEALLMLPGLNFRVDLKSSLRVEMNLKIWLLPYVDLTELPVIPAHLILYMGLHTLNNDLYTLFLVFC